MLKKLLFLGVKRNFSRIQKFRILMSNLLALISIILTLVLSIAHIYSGDNYLIIVTQLFNIILGTSVLASNRAKRYLLTECILFIIYPIWITLIAALLGQKYHFEQFLILTGLGAMFVISYRWLCFLMVIFNLFLFLGVRIYFIFHPESLVFLSDKALPILYLLNGSIPFLMLILLLDNTFRNNLHLYSKLKNITNNQDTIIEETTRLIEEQSYALKQSNEEYKRFSYISAHDLREPLRNILGFSQLIERNVNKGRFDNVQEYMGYVNLGIARIDNLTKGIVSFIDLEDQIPNVELVDLQIVVDELAAKFREKYPNLQLIAQYLPTLKINRELCYLLFDNLILNAIIYGDKSAQEVNIKAVGRGHLYRFSVQDNGKGFSMEYSKTVFEMFKRLHNDLDKSGSGIGLAICKKIVTAYRGKIWVESIENVGTTFYFTLPKT